MSFKADITTTSSSSNSKIDPKKHPILSIFEEDIHINLLEPFNEIDLLRFNKILLKVIIEESCFEDVAAQKNRALYVVKNNLRVILKLLNDRDNHGLDVENEIETPENLLINKLYFINNEEQFDFSKGYSYTKEDLVGFLNNTWSLNAGNIVRYNIIDFEEQAGNKRQAKEDIEKANNLKKMDVKEENARISAGVSNKSPENASSKVELKEEEKQEEGAELMKQEEEDETKQEKKIKPLIASPKTTTAEDEEEEKEEEKEEDIFVAEKETDENTNAAETSNAEQTSEGGNIEEVAKEEDTLERREETEKEKTQVDAQKGQTQNTGKIELEAEKEKSIDLHAASATEKDQAVEHVILIEDAKTDVPIESRTRSKRKIDDSYNDVARYAEEKLKRTRRSKNSKATTDESGNDTDSHHVDDSEVRVFRSGRKVNKVPTENEEEEEEKGDLIGEDEKTTKPSQNGDEVNYDDTQEDEEESAVDEIKKGKKKDKFIPPSAPRRSLRRSTLIVTGEGEEEDGEKNKNSDLKKSETSKKKLNEDETGAEDPPLLRTRRSLRTRK